MHLFGQHREARIAAALIGTGAAIAFAAATNFLGPPLEHHWPDSENYILIALGRLDEAMAPFTSRLLVPVLAGRLHAAFGIDIPAAFFIVSAVSAAAFYWYLMRIFALLGVRPVIGLALALTPGALYAFRDIYLPDAASMAFGAAALFYVLRANTPAVVAAVFFAALAREATLIFALFLAWFYVLRRDRRAAVFVIVAATAGLALVRLFAGQPNVHGMHPLAYTAMKVPVLLLENAFGLEFWLPNGVRGSCAEPMLLVPVAGLPMMGALREFGICEPSYFRLIATYSALLGKFGILPGFVLAIVVRHWRRLHATAPWTFVVVAYGLTMFALGICTGRAVERLVVYGWPAFWIGSAALWIALGRPAIGALPALAVVHLVATWLVFFSDLLFGWNLAGRELTLVIGLAGNIWSLAIGATLGPGRTVADGLGFRPDRVRKADGGVPERG